LAVIQPLPTAAGHCRWQGASWCQTGASQAQQAANPATAVNFVNFGDPP